MATEITQIPQASQLQQQLDILNQAIASLNAGMPVTSVTVKQDMNVQPPVGTPMMGATRVELNPPIEDATTLATLSSQLQLQADSVTQQLVEMGYAEPPPPVWRKESR